MLTLPLPVNKILYHLNIKKKKKNIKKTTGYYKQKSAKLSVLDLTQVPVQINTLLCIYIMRKK